MEILESWPGTNYDDICISEIFFNDCLVSPQVSTENIQIENVFLNSSENILMITNKTNQEVPVYTDSLATLQIIDVSENRKWAILISMNAQFEGRTETEYLLIDLINKKVFNSQLEKTHKKYLSGSPLFFENGDSNKTYLVSDEFRIELR